MKSFVHIYTGNGKGKTTAAFGLAIRAIGAGKKVFIGQFVKGKEYNEIIAVNKYIEGITIRQYGLKCFIIEDPTDEDKEAACKGFEEISVIIKDGKYDMVIMDEIFIALYYKLIDTQCLIDLIESRSENVELILTGRYAPKEIIDTADLVTEMKEIKHYYTKGILAREGIEY